MEINQTIKLKKEGNHQSLSYENNNTKLYRTLNEDEYDKLFNKLRPNIDFSLPDRLIQSFVKDGTILPSYKKSPLFTIDDFESITEPLKRDLPFLTKLQNGIKRNKRNNLPKITKKNKKNNKNKKNKILNKIMKQKSKQPKQPKQQKKQEKTRKNKKKQENKK